MSSSFDKACVRLAKKAREKRTDLDLTQEAVAEAAGLSPRHYQKFEAGELNVTLKTLCRVADALKVPLRDFF
jgi:transcriptional regulator with XRE-family HTH domain